MSEVIQVQRFGGIGGETEYLRRRNNHMINKEKRNKAIRLRGFHVALIFIIMVLAGFVAYKIGDFLLTWEKLRVQHFDYIDLPMYEGSRIEATLQKFKINILSLSFSDLRQTLLKFNEVKDVSFTRKLPNTVEIRFFLRKPVFQVARNGKFNIIDDEGIIVFTSNESYSNLIQIQDAADPDILDIVRFLPELVPIKSSIEYISYKKPYGITIKLFNRKELFYPGENNFAQKINRYLKFKDYPQLTKYDITSVDLRFQDRFYFEYRTEVNN